MEKIKQVKLSSQELEDRRSVLSSYDPRIKDESISRILDQGNDTFVFASKQAKRENEVGNPKYVIKLWKSRGADELPERYKAITDQAISKLAELKISNPYFFRPNSTATLIEINPILKIKRTKNNVFTISPYVSGNRLHDYENNDMKKIRITNILKNLYSQLFPYLQEFMISQMIDDFNIKVQEDENGNVVKIIITDLFGDVSSAVGLIEHFGSNSQL